MDNLKSVKVITIKGEKFELDISKLTVDSFLKIEASKQILSRDEYYKLATTWLVSASNAANLVDMISIFRVLCPEIERCLSTKSFETLNIMDIQEILLVYVKEVAPWYNGWMKKFNSPFEIAAEDEDNNESGDSNEVK